MKEHFSPSNKYKLIITNKETKPGCWNYSTGEVSLNDNIIAVVNRNYGSFPFLFVENHPNGHDYLICGEDYQGQTVIELDTGKRINFLPPEAEKGFGFCWGSYEFNKENNILAVDGCIWACPYEFRFFDFSDPMNGWPEIKLDDDHIFSGVKQPEITGNIIKTFDVGYFDDDEENEEENEEKLKAIKTFKREGNKLIFQNEWVSEEEQQYRKDQEIAKEKYDAKIKLFKETDLLYLKYKELIKEMPNKLDHAGWGWTHESWCPDFKVMEDKYSHRINYQQSKGYTIDLDWGIETAPIKLTIFKDGNNYENKFFKHSVNGMEEAFNYSKKLIGETNEGNS